MHDALREMRHGVVLLRFGRCWYSPVPGDEPVHHDALGLPDAVAAGHRLNIVLGEENGGRINTYKTKHDNNRDHGERCQGDGVVVNPHQLPKSSLVCLDSRVITHTQNGSDLIPIQV